VFKFITNKPLWVNILVGIVLSVLLVIGFFASLSFITGHGNYKRVPALVGQNISAAKATLEAQGFTVQITDSVFISTFPALSVTKQIPESDAMVKAGRTIYLTINRAVPPQIDMPSLVGFSFKSAEMYLASIGLKLGDTTYRADFARNAVLEQLYNNQPIKPGTKIPYGSTIGFVLGSGIGGTEIDVPSLVGLTLAQAKMLLASHNLSIGSIVAQEGNITDSSMAYIVKQSPEAFTELTPGQKMPNKTRAGSSFDVYISNTAPPKDSIATPATANP
jgi:eukaryotic-like serine/threonine-protein kinase